MFSIAFFSTQVSFEYFFPSKNIFTLFSLSLLHAKVGVIKSSWKCLSLKVEKLQLILFAAGAEVTDDKL